MPGLYRDDPFACLLCGDPECESGRQEPFEQGDEVLIFLTDEQREQFGLVDDKDCNFRGVVVATTDNPLKYQVKITRKDLRTKIRRFFADFVNLSRAPVDDSDSDSD